MANNTNRILISLIIGLCVAGLSFKAYADMQSEMKKKDQLIAVMKFRDAELEKKKISYVTPTRDMKAGETVTLKDIKLAKFNEHAGGLTSLDAAAEKVLVLDVQAGEILTKEAFIGVDINKKIGLREGHRAITVSTSILDGLSYEMKEGVLIDIYGQDNSNPIVFSKIKILSLETQKAQTTAEAVKDIATKEEEEVSIKDADTATFEIPISKVTDFVAMYSSGRILLAMRPFGDDTTVVTKKKADKKAVSSQNTNYDSATLPKLPTAQTFETPMINGLPLPISPTVGKQKTVEVIEASNKTEVSFE